MMNIIKKLGVKLFGGVGKRLGLKGIKAGSKRLGKKALAEATKAGLKKKAIDAAGGLALSEGEKFIKSKMKPHQKQIERFTPSAEAISGVISQGSLPQMTELTPAMRRRLAKQLR